MGFHSPLNRRARKSLHIRPTYNVSTSVTRANIRQWVMYNHVFHKISNFDQTEIAHTNDEKGGTKILMLAILCADIGCEFRLLTPFALIGFPEYQF